MLAQTMPVTQAFASCRRAFFPRLPCLASIHRFRAALAALLALGLTWQPQPLRSHPLQAPPLDHPHVFTFSQFYLPEDDDAFLTQGGLVLLAELNCAACHAPPAAWADLLGPIPGPDLSSVGSRLNIDALWRWIRSPQHRKPGTLMPGLFAGNAEPDAAAIEAVATYLASLQQPLPTPPPGDAAQGRQLYHAIGCVACHEPATDYRPPSLPAGTDPEKPALASVPIAFADDYSFPALVAFLRDPLAHRPASRMPSQHLSLQEAADLAAYLHTGVVAPGFQERQILQIPPQSAEQGRQLFQQHRCTACHSTPDPAATALAAAPPALKPLAALDPAAAAGCLTEGLLRTGTPHYDLSPLQVRALRLALRAVQSAPQPPLTPAEKSAHHLSRLNCYACHDHEGRGGPEIARAAYLTPMLQERPNDDFQNLPPTLDGVSTRLDAAALHRRLTDPPARAPQRSSVRMPRFSPDAVRPLKKLLTP